VGSFFDDKQNVQPRETVVGPNPRSSSNNRPEKVVSGASRVYGSFNTNSDRLGKPVGSSFDGGKNEQPRETIVGPRPGTNAFRRNVTPAAAAVGRTMATPNQPFGQPNSVKRPVESSPPMPRAPSNEASVSTPTHTKSHFQTSKPPSSSTIAKEERSNVETTVDNRKDPTVIKQDKSQAADKPRVFIATASDFESTVEPPSSPQSVTSSFLDSTPSAPPTEPKTSPVDNSLSAYEKQFKSFFGIKQEPVVKSEPDSAKPQEQSSPLSNEGSVVSSFFEDKKESSIEKQPVVEKQVPSSPLPDLGAAVSNLQGTMSAYEQQLKSYLNNMKDTVLGNGAVASSESTATVEPSASATPLPAETEASLADTYSPTFSDTRGIQDFYSGGPPRR
jgi:hypothetical protein